MGSHLLKQCLTKKHDPCIWMQAGVVRRKFCKRDYECTPCSFDRSLRRTAEENRRLRQRGMARAGRRGAIGFWKDRMTVLPPVRRPCIHHMKKRIDFKACTNEYQCSRCEFDQYFNDHLAVHAVVRPVDVLDVDGFKIPQGYYLHQGHAWAKIEAGAEVRIGMDDFVLRLMGPFDQIEAPLIGKTVKQGRANIRLSRGPRRAQLLSPVSGVITAVNPRLRERGGRANQDPYADGWIATIHTDNLRGDLKNLMISNESEEFIGHEVRRLYRVIEETAGPMATDGGCLSDDIYGKIPALGWDRLANIFLRS